MQYRKFSNSFLGIVLKVICIIGVVGFLFWLGNRQEWTSYIYWSGLLLGLGILIHLIISVVHSVKHYGEQPTEWTGIVDVMKCWERDKWREENISSYFFSVAGVSPRKEEYIFFIEVSGIQFIVNKGTFTRLSEGDEVRVSYWSDSKEVTEVSVLKKIEPDKAKQIKEKKRKEAFQSYRRRLAK